MNKPTFRDWRSVQDEVLRRIHAREWKPGDLIPNEVELATEFGCARTTVNRALRSLAESGMLDRRRKAGTRVAAQPIARATLEIAVIRKEVEDKGQTYGYQLIEHTTKEPDASIRGSMRTEGKLLHLRALHFANKQPYALEDRWINIQHVPHARDEPFETVSANEWLLAHAPYTHGEISFSAKMATMDEAGKLCCPSQSALFVIDRMTWDNEHSVTKVRLLFSPGHRLDTQL